jgi:hypothetical protein
MQKTTIEKPFYDQLLDGPIVSWTPKKSKVIVAETSDISPNQARYILKKYNNINRKLSSVNVTKYASDMTAGRWKNDGETIIFSKEGDLLNGQHRLLGVIKSNTSQNFLISYGVDKSTFDVMDNGKSRTTSDVLGMMKYENSAILAALARTILAYERNGGFNAKNFKGANQISKSETIAYIEANPEIGNYIERYKKCSLVPSSVTSFLYWLFSNINKAHAEQYLNMVLMGYGISPDTLESYLFNKLQRNRNAIQNKMTKNAVISNIIIGWNRFRGHSKSSAIQIIWKPENGLPKPR